MITFLISALKIVFVLGFLILIHELGHFLVAKLCKVRVNEFAIGFGPTIWRKQGKVTKYALRLIPLGGFVNMEGEEARSEEEGSFSKASIGKRIAIVLAGGLVNIIFGLMIYFLLMSITAGNVGSSKGNTSNEVASVLAGYNAETSGIQANDKILKINNKTIHLKDDITESLSKAKGEEVTVLIQRGNDKREIKLKPTEIKSKNTGIYFGVASDAISTQIVALFPGSPAEQKGIQIKDIVTKVNGQDVNNNPYKVVELIEQAATENIVFTLQRNEEEIEVTLTPEIVSDYYLGVELKQAESNFANNIYYGFWNTTDFTFSIMDNVKMLFTGKVSTNQLMGPIGISEMVAKTNGISSFIYLLALISLSLGISNLLPFPPLDGGKVVLLIIEAIRRKPLKEEFEIGLQTLGFAILIALSIYIAYNDVLRIF